MNESKLMLGANYYPEDWPEEMMAGDIAMMKEMGMRVVRVGEFAWAKDEPREGEIDFSWLHRVVEAMKAAGIGVILGTPSATPPHWLVRKHPDVCRLMPDGSRVSHGGRRHCCSNNPHYRAHTARIVEAMAKEFGSDTGVIGWQIDNEIYSHDIGCVCEHCMRYFHKHLEKKFGTVEALNRAWNLNLFSQAYDSFSDIPAPTRTWHNPHIMMEWDIAQNAGHVEFVQMQADILHGYTAAPVGTDTMPFYGMDYRTLHEKMDVSQFNHYHTPENLVAAAMWMDCMRQYSRRPFWNTETQPCWNGATAAEMTVMPDGFIRLNSWLPIVLGGEANLYWLWRTHWAGHELMHGAVLDTSGRPVYTAKEIKRTAEEFARAEAFLTRAGVKCIAALQYTSLNWNMGKNQNMTHLGNVCDETANRFYTPMVQIGLHPDVIDSHAPLDGYKILVSPFAYTLEEGDFPDRVREWVENGGVWIVGPMSDIRTKDGTKYLDRPYGMLEALTGARQKYFLPAYGGALRARWEDGGDAPLCHTFETFTVPEGARVLARIDGGHSEADRLPCVLDCPVGKGHVILLGAVPDPSAMRKLLTDAARENGIALPATEGESLLVVRREGADARGWAIADLFGKGGVFRFEGTAEEVLSGKRVTGEIAVEPFGVLVLKEC